MKNLLNTLLVFGLLIMSAGCTSEPIDLPESSEAQLNPPCVDNDPVTRVINDGTTSYSLEVVAADGTVVVSFPNIPPSSTTSWVSFEEGEYMFSLKTYTDIASDDKVLLQMDQCMAYEIQVNVNNQIESYIPTSL